MNRPHLLRSVATSLLLVACGGSATPAPSPASTPSAAATPPPSDPAPAPEAAKEEPKQDAAPKPFEAGAPTVKVVEAGAAPRRALRYEFKAGVSEYVTMDMKMAMTMSMGDKGSPRMDLPTVRSTLRIDAKELTPEGDLRVGLDTLKVEVLKDGKVEAGLSAILEKEVVQLVGMKGSARISNRGVATETDFELPPSASPKLRSQLESMRDAIRNMYMPLPEEEVGKGAKWVVSSRLPISGAAVDMKANYTLRKLEAGSAQADVETSLGAAPNQAMTMGALPPGASATLEMLEGKGTGKLSPSFTKVISPGTNKLAMTMAFNVASQNEKMSMKMATDIGVTIQPAKAPAEAAKK